MRTNIVLDDKLVKEAMRLANVRTMREAVAVALKRFVQSGRQRKLLESLRHRRATQGLRLQAGALRELMYLVDTSVWVDYLRGNTTRQADALKELLSGDQIVGVSPIILQDILQGADSD